MYKIYITILMAIGLTSFVSNKSNIYSDAEIKKIAFTETLDKKQVAKLMYRPITNSVSRNYRKYKVSRLELGKIITSMICLETGILKSNAMMVNNLTGIKAIKSRPSFTFKTTEFVGGKMIVCDQSFSAFFSFEDSLDNLFLLWDKPRYSGLKSAKNYSEFIKALGKSGYATDPEYGNKILRIYKEI